jgi:hypothetical protein
MICSNCGDSKGIFFWVLVVAGDKASLTKVASEFSEVTSPDVDAMHTTRASQDRS